MGFRSGRLSTTTFTGVRSGHQSVVRVLKPNRMFIVWGTLKTETFLRYKLQTTDNHAVLTPQNEIIWGYNWGGRSKGNFARKHEYAWCWSKGEDFSVQLIRRFG